MKGLCKVTSVNSYPFSFIMTSTYFVYAATAQFCSMAETGGQESGFCSFSLICSFGKYLLSSYCVLGPVLRAQDMSL